MKLMNFFSNDGHYLEIGPLDNPFFKRPQYDVRYLDFYDTETIKKLYRDSYANIEKIVRIDFPTHGKTYKETVGNEMFDAVYSSHCIEHTHDFIEHLKDVSDILQDDGRYVFVVPDKNNCFDYYRSPTSFREIYSVYLDKQIHSFISDAVFNSCTYGFSVPTKEFWQKEVSFIPDILMQQIDPPLTEYCKKIFESDDPLSCSPTCHKWVFTHKSLMEILRDMLRFNLLPFSIEFHQCTSSADNYNIEVVLRKNKHIENNPILRAKEIFKVENFIEKTCGIKSKWLDLIDGTIKPKKIYLYGAGDYGKKLFYFLKDFLDTEIEFIVSDDTFDENNDLPAIVRKVSEINIACDALIIIAVRNSNICRSMTETLLKRGYTEGNQFIRLSSC